MGFKITKVGEIKAIMRKDEVDRKWGCKGERSGQSGFLSQDAAIVKNSFTIVSHNTFQVHVVLNRNEAHHYLSDQSRRFGKLHC